jgi:hypothetical protein
VILSRLSPLIANLFRTMRTHQRHVVLLLAIALLATAAVLGIARWSQRTAISGHGLSSDSSPPADTAAFRELPRAADGAHLAESTLATKASQRPPGTRTSQAGQPRPGEITYQMEDLPKACGTYWVADANGGFSRVAVCNPENHPGGSH